jgi:hypothetical protein
MPSPLNQRVDKENHMKKIVAIALFLASAYAMACTTQTIIVGGKMMTCTTCGTVTNCF